MVIESGSVLTLDSTLGALMQIGMTGGRIKVGSFERDTSLASGDQAITGVGFQPKAVIFITVTEATAEVSIGVDDGSSHKGIYQQSAGVWGGVGNKSMYLYQAAGVTYDGYISSLDTDGFTITWAKAGAKTGTATIGYIAFR